MFEQQFASKYPLMDAFLRAKADQKRLPEALGVFEIRTVTTL